LQLKLKTEREKIPKLQKEIEYLKTKIEEYERHLKLISEIKSIDFEELKKINEANQHAMDLLKKKWNTIEKNEKN